MSGETDYLCIGICLPDEDEAYCIGCGRPWGTASVPSPLMNEAPDNTTGPAGPVPSNKADAVSPAPPPHARNPGALPPTGGRASAWDGPAPTKVAPHARNPGSLPPTGGRASARDGPAPTNPDDEPSETA